MVFNRCLHIACKPRDVDTVFGQKTVAPESLTVGEDTGPLPKGQRVNTPWYPENVAAFQKIATTMHLYNLRKTHDVSQTQVGRPPKKG